MNKMKIIRLKNHYKQALTSFFLTIFMAGCGFHLQGTHASLPPEFQNIYVDSSQVPHSALAPELTVALKNSGVNCVNEATDAKIILNILSDSNSNHQIGSGASQETRKYELTDTVSLNLLDKTGKILYGPTTVSSSLSHYVYSGQVLGNNQEESTLYTSLRHNVIQQIIFKLGSEEVKYALEQKEGKNNPSSSI